MTARRRAPQVPGGWLIARSSHRLRLKNNLSAVVLARSFCWQFKPLLDPDPGGNFRTKTTDMKPFRKYVQRLSLICNGHSPTEKYSPGCNGYETAVAAGQSQRFYF
jgi:hypothetical protein